VDDRVAEAVLHYDRLLKEDPDLEQELAGRFEERMRRASLTFGGRILCPFFRPNFVSPDLYEEVRTVCAAVFRTIERAEDHLGRDLWRRVDLTPEETALAEIDPGYRRSSPSARLDAFVTPSSYQFVELNAETPAGIAYNDVLVEVFLELPVMRRFQERFRLRRFRSRERLLETLVGCYREAGGRKERPAIAVVDYDEVPTRTEHHLFREFFEAQGYPSLVCDPRRLEYDGRRLRHDGVEIDIVYKRLLVNELLEKKGELAALVGAASDGAVTVVNPFRCKPIHKKAIFAVITDDELQRLFTDEERAAIAAHVPWTRRVVDGPATRRGVEIDLARYVREHRETLVLKPNDEYGGKGVFIGSESSQADWERALDQALAGSYVVQDKLELQRESFPEASPGLPYRNVIVDLDPFVFNGEVEGFLTRLSGSTLANVTSGGGEVPAFVVIEQGGAVVAPP
jgi:hypothetical protein